MTPLSVSVVMLVMSMVSVSEAFVTTMFSGAAPVNIRYGTHSASHRSSCLSMSSSSVEPETTRGKRTYESCSIIEIW